MNRNDELDAIIDRHAGPNPPERDCPQKARRPELRPFTAADTQAYNGCIAEHPEIAHLPWGDVILDGDEVTAVLPDGAWADEITTKLPSKSIARLVATQLLTIQDGSQSEVWHAISKLLKDYEPPF